MSSPLLLNRGGVLRRGFVKGSDLALLPTTTPPENPSAGDLWIRYAADGLWMFVWDTTEASAYKWKFIGGPPIWAHYDYPGATNIGNSTYTLVPNCFVTVPRSGDYIFTGDAQFGIGSTASSTEVILALGTGSAGSYALDTSEGASYFAFPYTAGASNVHPFGQVRVDGAVAGTTFKLLAWAASTGTNTVSMGRLSCVPVRVA